MDNTNIYKPFEWLNNLDKVAVIWINGPIQTSFAWLRIWNSGHLRYCTDGAANRLQILCQAKTAKTPHLIVGDFDSISTVAKSYFSSLGEKVRLVENSDQDTTDLTKTLNLLMRASEIKSDFSIILLGGLSGRFDHVLGTLNSLLIHQNSSPISIFALDGKNMLTILKKGKTDINLKLKNLTLMCGLMPICQKMTKVTTKGFYWNLDNKEMEYGKLVSNSNKIDSSTLFVETSAPLVFSLELEDEESLW